MPTNIYNCNTFFLSVATRTIITSKTIEWKEQIPGKFKDGLQNGSMPLGRPLIS